MCIGNPSPSNRAPPVPNARPRIQCAKFRPVACELAPPAAEALTGGGGAAAGGAAALATSTKTSASGLMGGLSAAAEDGTPRRSAALMARSCKAAGARPLSAAECQQAAGRQGYGRKWLGTTTSATEAAGCVLWEEQGNVEYNAKTEQPVCNVRGTCLCKGSDGREVQIIGMPKYVKGVEGRVVGRELEASFVRELTRGRRPAPLSVVCSECVKSARIKERGEARGGTRDARISNSVTESAGSGTMK